MRERRERTIPARFRDKQLEEAPTVMGRRQRHLSSPPKQKQLDAVKGTSGKLATSTPGAELELAELLFSMSNACPGECSTDLRSSDDRNIAMPGQALIKHTGNSAQLRPELKGKRTDTIGRKSSYTAEYTFGSPGRKRKMSFSDKKHAKISKNDNRITSSVPTFFTPKNSGGALFAKWCTYEYFYSPVDAVLLLGDGCDKSNFTNGLVESWAPDVSWPTQLTKVKRVSAAEGTMSSRPRRFSRYFVSGQLKDLESKRSFIRRLQHGLQPHLGDTKLPNLVPGPLVVGQRVLARYYERLSASASIIISGLTDVKPSLPAVVESAIVRAFKAQLAICLAAECGGKAVERFSSGIEVNVLSPLDTSASKQMSISPGTSYEDNRNSKQVSTCSNVAVTVAFSSDAKRELLCRTKFREPKLYGSVKRKSAHRRYDNDILWILSEHSDCNEMVPSISTIATEDLPSLHFSVREMKLSTRDIACAAPVVRPGFVLATNLIAGTYRIAFDDPDIGIDSVVDCDVALMEPTQLIPLSTLMKERIQVSSSITSEKIITKRRSESADIHDKSREMSFVKTRVAISDMLLRRVEHSNGSAHSRIALALQEVWQCVGLYKKDYSDPMLRAPCVSCCSDVSRVSNDVVSSSKIISPQLAVRRILRIKQALVRELAWIIARIQSYQVIDDGWPVDIADLQHTSVLIEDWLKQVDSAAAAAISLLQTAEVRSSKNEADFDANTKCPASEMSDVAGTFSCGLVAIQNVAYGHEWLSSASAKMWETAIVSSSLDQQRGGTRSVCNIGVYLATLESVLTDVPRL